MRISLYFFIFFSQPHKNDGTRKQSNECRYGYGRDIRAICKLYREPINFKQMENELCDGTTMGSGVRKRIDFLIGFI